jgi:hypothetical protein
MNPPANHRITTLTDEHSKLLRELGRDWTRHELSANAASREEIKQTVKTLYKRAGLKEPTVIICESIFQMTVYPVIIALMLDETAMDEALPLLRRNLQNPPWARFWENLDPQIEKIRFGNCFRRAKRRTRRSLCASTTASSITFTRL